MNTVKSSTVEGGESSKQQDVDEDDGKKWLLQYSHSTCTQGRIQGYGIQGTFPPPPPPRFTANLLLEDI